MKNLTVYYGTPKQGILPAFFSECLDITDPVFTFDRFMEEIDLRKYLSKLPAHKLGRIRYNPVNMLKTVLFGFMDASLSESWKTIAKSISAINTLWTVNARPIGLSDISSILS